MNRDQFKKNLYRHFRIQPAMQLYEGNGALRGAIDDAWIVMAIADKTFTLRNRATDHFIELAFDSYVNFLEDPQGKEQHQTEGILVLKVQLYMHDGLLKFAQTVAPGKELRDFTPPATRKSLAQTVRERINAEALQALRDDFDRNSFAKAVEEINQIRAVIDSLVSELTSQGLNVRVFVHQANLSHLLWVCGWWVTITWHPRGLPSESYISVSKWRGRPDMPGLRPSFESPVRVSEEKCHFGLARVDEVGWIAPRHRDVALGTRELLERLFTDLYEHPGDDPSPV